MRCNGVRNELNAGRGRRIDTERAALIAANLHDGYFDDYFGLGLVEVVQKFFGHRNLVRRDANNDRILGGNGLNALNVKNLANGVNGVLKIVRTGNVAEIEGLYDTLLKFLALGWSVGGDEDGVRCNRAPER